MTANDVKAKVLEIVAQYDRGVFDVGDMDSELHRLAVRVAAEERLPDGAQGTR